MQMCKKCEEIKYDFQFEKEYMYGSLQSVYRITSLCKSCAKEIGNQAKQDYIEKNCL